MCATMLWTGMCGMDMEIKWPFTGEWGWVDDDNGYVNCVDK